MEAILPRYHNVWIAPLFIFLFLFNTAFLPEGLSFSLLLTPVWLFLLYRMQGLRYLTAFCLVLGTYMMIHLWLGVIVHYYLISTLMLFCTGVFALTTAMILSKDLVDLEGIFNKILILNFLLALCSIPLLLFPSIKSVVWYSMSMSDQIRVIARLKLFTSEASHYSYLIAPLFIFYYCKALFQRESVPWLALFMISVPMAMSLSFGVIGCLTISGMILIGFRFRRVFNSSKKRSVLLASMGGAALVLLILFVFYRHNLFFLRIDNILNGRDTSFRGRTYESFILAHKILQQKSLYWGIGPGQLKVFAREIIIQYYFYSRIPETIRIPNAVAETIVCYGYIGVVLRIGLQVFLFFRTGVRKNPYRLWLFLFLFIFQFMGSYITNAAEYVFWILCFSNISNQLFENQLNTKVR